MLVTLLTVAEIAYLIGLGTWIVLEKRSPAATLAWILSLAAIPYAGFIIYFLIGPRRLRRRRLRHARARLKVRAATELKNLPNVLTSGEFDVRARQLMILGMQAGEGMPSSCQALDILHSAAATYEAIEKAIRGATRHIHLCYYIFEKGEVGAKMRDLLAERARAGVKVRLLLDHVGSASANRTFLRPLIEAGGQVAWFNPVRLRAFRDVMNFRNHRKILICDGDVGFTGGINISDDYLDRDGHKGWRDTHLRVEGSAVRWLQLTFLDDWYFATRHVPHEDDLFPRGEPAGEHTVQVVASGPDQDWEAIQKLYFAAIAGAQHRVLVTTPYFVPDESMLTALTTAALRGVAVSILLPSRGDSMIVTYAARSYYDDLLRAGAKIYEYEPTMLHAKTLVVDNFFAAVGTANMDNRSFRLSFEVTVALYEPRNVDEVAAQFDRDLTLARNIDASHRGRANVFARVGEATARLMSPLL